MMFGNVLFRLARAHKVPVTHLSKFESRIKNLQRLGWPSQTKTGRGVAADWTEESLYDLGIALEFTGLFIGPDQAITISKNNIDKLRAAARKGEALDLEIPNPFGGGTGSKFRLDFRALHETITGPEPSLA